MSKISHGNCVYSNVKENLSKKNLRIQNLLSKIRFKIKRINRYTKEKFGLIF